MGTQSEAPAEMQCGDKFLVQSVVVREGTTVEDVTQDKDMVVHIPMYLHCWIIFSSIELTSEVCVVQNTCR
jgi:NAD-dependent DNA ligase